VVLPDVGTLRPSQLYRYCCKLRTDMLSVDIGQGSYRQWRSRVCHLEPLPTPLHSQPVVRTWATSKTAQR